MDKLFFLTLFGLVAASWAYPNLDLTKPYLPWKWGSCLKNVGTIKFKPQQFFNGTWYEYASFGNYLFQADGICSALNSEVKDDVVNSIYYQYEPLLKKYMYLRSRSSLKDVSGSSFKLQYDFFAGLASIEIPFSVAATDYKNYAILYSCQEAFGFKAEMSWLMTRIQGDYTKDKEFTEALSKYGLKFSDYIPQKTTECGPNVPQL